MNETKTDESLLAIQEAQADIEMYNKYGKLTQIPEFVEIIMVGYLQEHATELFQQLINGECSDKDQMEQNMRKIEAIGGLTEYIEGLRTKAEIAKVRIEREHEFMAGQEEAGE